MAMSRPSIERLVAIAIAAAVLLAPAGIARANMRAPIVEAKPPSSALAPTDRTTDVLVLGETLSFHCEAAACAVEARYRVRADAPIVLELAFIIPSATPVAVQVGGAGTPVTVSVAPPEALPRKEVDHLEDKVDVRRFPVLQAKFAASLIAGENSIVVTYRQPLGRMELDHGYFKKGRFVEFFRYEVWPLSEWKHAPGFFVAGDVTIRRPPPSWWKRTFSNPRSLGCRGPGPIAGSTLEQRGDDLRLAFRLGDPLPKRLWCEIGEQDLIAQP
jgi:hypothetical protein